MAMLTTSNNGSLATEEVGRQMVQRLYAESVALQSTKVVRTGSTQYNVPVVTDDPNASFVQEAQDIALSDATVLEQTISPRKSAGLVRMSNELAQDSTMAIQIVVDGLVRDIKRVIDEAFFGNLTGPAPAGLESLTNVNVISSQNTEWQNLDLFATAISEAQTVSATVDSFVMHPTDALALSQLKVGQGSNQPLLGQDVTSPTGKSIFGVPMRVSEYVTPGTVWGLPSDRVLSVLREPAEVDVSDSAYFQSDSIAIRGTARIAWGYVHEAAIQKLVLA